MPHARHPRPSSNPQVTRAEIHARTVAVCVAEAHEWAETEAALMAAGLYGPELRAAGRLELAQLQAERAAGRVPQIGERRPRGASRRSAHAGRSPVHSRARVRDAEVVVGLSNWL